MATPGFSGRLGMVGVAGSGFDTLLSALGPDRELAGAEYERLRRSLVSFFEWRSCVCPEELADRTIDRVSRKLSSGEALRAGDPSGYFYAVARNILMEYWAGERRKVRALARFGEARTSSPAVGMPHAGERDQAELELACLERCLGSLHPETRHFIIRYYEGDQREKIQNRRALSSDLEISLNALRNRAQRLRGRLEICMERCLRRKGHAQRFFESETSSS